MDILFTKLKRLKNNKGFIKYFKNTFLLFFEKILRLVVGLFIGVWVARYLGPEKFGLLNYAISFVIIFSFVTTLGLNNIIVRELVNNKTKRDLIIGAAFWLKFIGSIFLVSSLIITLNFFSKDVYTNKIIIIISISYVFQSFNVIDYYFQSQVLSRFIVLSNIISLIISSIVKIHLITIDASLMAFVYAFVFDSFILALGFIYFYIKNNLSLKRWVFNKNFAIHLLKNSWPLMLGGIMITIYMKIDQIMIKEILGNEAVGQYSAAVKLSESWYFIPMIISSSLFPAIINAKKISENIYYKRLQNLFTLMVWMALALAIPMTFLSDWVIDILYGEKYINSGGVLAIHIWAGIFVFLGVASERWFISENLQKLSFWRTFLGMLSNVFLNMILIPKFGLKGAAFATLVSQIMAAFVFDLLNKKTRKLFYMKCKTIIPIYRKL
ncbi:flippase [Psychroserpens sp. Hel_I_66]|uniref:flippase n=1 Tax=Psychroserpens sp. Hel_I_66 TaxID=1250004 RepID=UPI000648C188|nr:flippase [Psychroserpens sp. Hel_I_66]